MSLRDREQAMDDDALTLPFETFWSWLVTHPNCVLRAGTPESVLYDDEDLHWHFAVEAPPAGGEGGNLLLVQVIRGKRLVGELFLEPEQVSYVQGSLGDREDEYVFELITESETDRMASYFFVLTHGYDGDDPAHAGHPQSASPRVH
jgi:hypothetical protein